MGSDSSSLKETQKKYILKKNFCDCIKNRSEYISVK